MKKLVCLLLAACVAALALAGCGGDKEEKENSSISFGDPGCRHTQPDPGTRKRPRPCGSTADSGLNVRAEASTDSEILGLADSGSRLALLVEEPKDGWYQIQYKGQTAYVSAEYAEVVEVSLEEYNQLRGDAPSSSGGEG